MDTRQKSSLDLDAENRSATILASAVRNASNNTADQVNTDARGAVVTIDVTAVPGVDTVTFTVKGKDSVSGKYYTILATAALVATGTTNLRVYPGLTAAANATANDVLPRDWRIEITHSAGSNFTYSVGVQYVK